jgi:hypothetical protein
MANHSLRKKTYPETDFGKRENQKLAVHLRAKAGNSR